MAIYTSTKTYGHERGLSCAFRQWRADSHCSLLHGYALSIHIEFSATSLDDRNWVIDFGGMKELEHEIKVCFDHTTVVAKDDPQLNMFEELQEQGMIKLRLLSNVGCEAFAEHVYKLASTWLLSVKQDARVWVSKVEIKEHGANGAIYKSGV